MTQPGDHPDLPAPDAGARAHSERLVAALRALIGEAGGRITFERFMHETLYRPGLGYYAAGTRKFGASGDFVTAPESTPLFGQCLARCVAAAGHLGDYELLEVGAGSGALAATLLPALAAAGCAPARYRILEVSPALRERQRAALAAVARECGVALQWDDDLPAPGYRGLVIANELLDAVPVRRFMLASDRVDECHVCWRDGGFAWEVAPPADELLAPAVAHAVAGIDLAPGYVSEIGPARVAWLREVLARLHAGLVLLIDYGYTRREYYHPDRRQGTLACHYRHRTHYDPFRLVGLQDISVHVDFSALAETGLAAGAEVAGFTTQGHFLLDCGLLDLCRDLDPRSPQYLRAAAAIRRLTLPGEMGEAVKVMALARGLDVPLPGFATLDLRGRLP